MLLTFFSAPDTVTVYVTLATVIFQLIACQRITSPVFTFLSCHWQPHHRNSAAAIFEQQIRLAAFYTSHLHSSFTKLTFLQCKWKRILAVSSVCACVCRLTYGPLFPLCSQCMNGNLFQFHSYINIHHTAYNEASAEEFWFEQVGKIPYISAETSTSTSDMDHGQIRANY